MEKKIENYTISFIEAIAAQRGRNVSWAAEAVRDSASITADQALEKKVIDVIAPSRQALMAAIQGREVKVRDSVVRLDTANPEFHEIEMTAAAALLLLSVAADAHLRAARRRRGGALRGVHASGDRRTGRDRRRLLVARRDRLSRSFPSI